jgi:hypothetical protein
MRDDPENPDGLLAAHNILTQISDALCIPVGAFLGRGVDPAVEEQLRIKQEAQVLTLVDAYLRDVDREARRRFVEAVRTLAEAKAR